MRTYNVLPSVADIHELNTTLNKIWQMDDASYKNKGVFAKEEMVASTAVSKSLKNVNIGSTK